MAKWRLMQSAKYPEPVPPIAPFAATTETFLARFVVPSPPSSPPSASLIASVSPAANSAGYARSGLRTSPSVTDPPTAPTRSVSFSPSRSGASFRRSRRDAAAADDSGSADESASSGPGNPAPNARSLCSWVVRVHPSGQRSPIGWSPSAHESASRASGRAGKGSPASSPPRVSFASAAPPENDARSASSCARIGRTACTPAKGTPHSANAASARMCVHRETRKRASLPHRAMRPPVARPAVFEPIRVGTRIFWSQVDNAVTLTSLTRLVFLLFR